MLPLWVHFGRGVSHMLIHTRQRGVSLIELMIGLVVGMIVVAGVIAIYVTNVRGGTYTIRTAKLNQELRASMDIIVADLRRAGYWGGAVVAGVPASSANPFSLRSGSQTDINIMTSGTARSCIMFAYDRDSSGDTTAPLAEIFGFRFSTDKVEMLTSGNQQSNDCTGSGWSAVTDNNTIVIDTLTFSFTGSQCMDGTKGLSWKLTAADTATNACAALGGSITMNDSGTYVAPASGDVLIETRQIVVSLRGHHKDDASMALSLVESVQVQNDRIYSQP